MTIYTALVVHESFEKWLRNRAIPFFAKVGHLSSPSSVRFKGMQYKWKHLSWEGKLRSDYPSLQYWNLTSNQQMWLNLSWKKPLTLFREEAVVCSFLFPKFRFSIIFLVILIWGPRFGWGCQNDFKHLQSNTISIYCCNWASRMSMNLASFFMLDLELDSDTYLLQRKRALKSMIRSLR